MSSQTPFESTAKRKRPQTLAQLAGQNFIRQTLSNAIASQRIAHAYLFSGPRGVGKTSTARVLARCLNCEKGASAQPCGQCNACQEITAGRCLDVIEIDGASHTGVDDVREIKDNVLYPPSSTRYKIFIIDEVHMLSNSAFNALLKTIEEPPDYMVFIFATTEVHKLPATVKSRCQQFHFRLIELEVLQSLLRESCQELQLEAEDQALLWLARQADGSLRDAYTLFDQIVSLCNGEKLCLKDILERLGYTSIEELSLLFDSLAAGQLQEALEVFTALLNKGVAVEQLCVDLASYLHELVLIKQGVTLKTLLNNEPALYSQKALNIWDTAQLRHALERAFEIYQRLRTSLNARYEVELFLCELAELSRYLSAQNIFEQLTLLREKMGLKLSNDAQAPMINPEKRLESQAAARRESLEADAPKEASKVLETQPKQLPAAEQTEHAEQESLASSEACRTLLLAAYEKTEHVLAAILRNIEMELNAQNLLLKAKSRYEYDTLNKMKKQMLSIVQEKYPQVERCELSEEKILAQKATDTTTDPELDIMSSVFRGEIEEEE